MRLVITRQRTGTGPGVVFLTFEDVTCVSNFVVCSSDFGQTIDARAFPFAIFR